MSTERPDHEPAATHEDARLANRTTALTLVSMLSFLAALMAMPLTFQQTERMAPRVVASSPLAVGLGTGLLARAARAQLRALRGGVASAERTGQQEPRGSGAGAGAGAPAGRDRRDA